MQAGVLWRETTAPAALVRVGIFIHSQTFAGRLVGRHVASRAFVEALKTENIEVTIFSEDVVPWPSKPLEKLPRAMLEGEIDVLHDLDLGHFIQLCGFRNAIGATTPVTAGLHSFSNPQFHPWLKAPGPTERDAVFCPSERIAAVIPRAGFSWRTFTIPHPVFPSSPSGVDLDIPASDIVITTVGRFARNDKQDLILLQDAVAAVRARNPGRGIALLLCGASQGESYEDEIAKRGCDKDIVMVDFPESLKGDILARTDIFISLASSIQESYGIAAIEAMLAGKPVIVTAFSGHLETVPPNAGIHVPVTVDLRSDPGPLGVLMSRDRFHAATMQWVKPSREALEVALDCMIEWSDADRRAMGERGRTHAQRYTPSEIVPQYLVAWNELRDTDVAPQPKPTPLGEIFTPLWSPAIFAR